MTTREKIGILAKEKGINLHKLSVMIDISYDTLYSIVKRKSKKVDVKIIEKIAEVLEVGYRFDGEEIIFYPFTDTIETPQEAINKWKNDTDNPKDRNNKFNLQLFGTDISAKEKLITQIDKLNDVGQQKALEQLELLTKIQEYLK